MTSKKLVSQPLNIVTKVSDLQTFLQSHSQQQIGFVPTMGHLHQGHLALCERAKQENDVTVVSIFVNKTQFNHVEDYNLYPRTIADDIALLESHQIDYLFLPDHDEIYADQYTYQLQESDMSTELEGVYRPGHFTGVLTVIVKLLNIISPHIAYFGEKDFQQLLLIKQMVKALFLPTIIAGCETIRDENGLALSSRNSRLSVSDRLHAANLYRLLTSDISSAEIIQALINLDFKVDYVAEKWQRRLGAVWLGNVRLIDNVPIK